MYGMCTAVCKERKKGKKKKETRYLECRNSVVLLLDMSATV